MDIVNKKLIVAARNSHNAYSTVLPWILQQIIILVLLRRYRGSCCFVWGKKNGWVLNELLIFIFYDRVTRQLNANVTIVDGHNIFLIIRTRAAGLYYSDTYSTYIGTNKYIIIMLQCTGNDKNKRYREHACTYNTCYTLLLLLLLYTQATFYNFSNFLNKSAPRNTFCGDIVRNTCIQ